MSEQPGEGVSPYGSPRSDEVIRRIRIPQLRAMKERGARKGLATLCLGGGDAVALSVERAN